jgi:hypothetical protein
MFQMNLHSLEILAMLFQSMDTLLDLDFWVSSHGHLVMFDIVPARDPTTYTRSNIAILLKATSCCSFLLLSPCLLSSYFIIKQQVVSSITY